MAPGISMVCLIPTTAFLWPTWHLGWQDTRSPLPRWVHTSFSCPHPVSRLQRHSQRIIFFEEGRHLWTRGQMQELLRLLLSFPPLPLVQLVERSCGLECFLSLDKQTNWQGGAGVQYVFSSLTGHIKRPFGILLRGDGYATGRINICQGCPDSPRLSGFHR